MNRLRDEHGVALVAALGMLLVVLPLGAMAVWQSRLQQLMARSARADVEGLYAAEAALARAVAAVPPGVGVDELLVGPDGVGGTVDDGTFPFAVSPGPPDFGVVSTKAGNASAGGMVRLSVTVTAAGGRQTRVEALVRRAAAPFTPAAAHVEGDWWGERTPGDVRFDGADHRLDDPPDAPSGPAPPRPGLSSTGPVDRGGGQAGGSGAGGSVAPAQPLGLGAVIDDLLDEPGAVLAAVPSEAGVVLGTEAAPQLSILRGDVVVAASLGGAGILVVDGSLRISGTLAFAGLVVVRHGIRLDPGAAIHVTGALWTGALTGFDMLGAGRVAYSSEALAYADRLAGGRLPRPVVVVGWREVL